MAAKKIIMMADPEHDQKLAKKISGYILAKDFYAIKRNKGKNSYESTFEPIGGRPFKLKELFEKEEIFHYRTKGIYISCE